MSSWFHEGTIPLGHIESEHMLEHIGGHFDQEMLRNDMFDPFLCPTTDIVKETSVEAGRGLNNAGSVEPLQYLTDKTMECDEKERLTLPNFNSDTSQSIIPKMVIQPMSEDVSDNATREMCYQSMVNDCGMLEAKWHDDNHHANSANSRRGECFKHLKSILKKAVLAEHGIHLQSLHRNVRTKETHVDKGNYYDCEKSLCDTISTTGIRINTSQSVSRCTITCSNESNIYTTISNPTISSCSRLGHKRKKSLSSKSANLTNVRKCSKLTDVSKETMASIDAKNLATCLSDELFNFEHCDSAENHESVLYCDTENKYLSDKKSMSDINNYSIDFPISRFPSKQYKHGKQHNYKNLTKINSDKNCNQCSANTASTGISSTEQNAGLDNVYYPMKNNLSPSLISLLLNCENEKIMKNVAHDNLEQHVMTQELITRAALKSSSDSLHGIHALSEHGYYSSLCSHQTPQTSNCRNSKFTKYVDPHNVREQQEKIKTSRENNASQDATHMYTMQKSAQTCYSSPINRSPPVSIDCNKASDITTTHVPHTSPPLCAPLLPAVSVNKASTTMSNLEKHLRGLASQPSEQHNLENFLPSYSVKTNPRNAKYFFLERLLTGEISLERYHQIDYHLLHEKRQQRLSLTTCNDSTT